MSEPITDSALATIEQTAREAFDCGDITVRMLPDSVFGAAVRIRQVEAERDWAVAMQNAAVESQERTAVETKAALFDALGWNARSSELGFSDAVAKVERLKQSEERLREALKKAVADLEDADAALDDGVVALEAAGCMADSDLLNIDRSAVIEAIADARAALEEE